MNTPKPPDSCAARSSSSAVPTAAHVVHYAAIVAHKATLRRLIQAAASITNIGYDEDTPLEDLLDKAEQTIFEVSQKNLKQNFIPISEKIVTRKSISNYNTGCTIKW